MLNISLATLLAGSAVSAQAVQPAGDAMLGNDGPATAASADVDTEYKNSHPPQYPAQAVKNHEQGMVMLDVTVDADGNPSDITPDEDATDAPQPLVDAAMKAAKGWHYTPAQTANGESTSGTVRVPVLFSVNPSDDDDSSDE